MPWMHIVFILFFSFFVPTEICTVINTDVRRLLVAPVFRLGVRLLLGSFELARDMPLAVPTRFVPRRLPGVLLHVSGRGSQAPVAGGVQPRPVS